MLIFLLIFCALSATSAKECCPSGHHLLKNTSLCSDNQTKVNLNCQDGKFILNPNGDESDEFSMVNGSLKYLGITSDLEFCVSKLEKNGTQTWEKQVALVCFENNNEDQDSLSIIPKILMLISTIFLFITLYVYIVLPNLKDLQGKCVIAFIFSLMVSFVTLLVVHTFSPESDEICVMQAALLYFFLSATFFWGNVFTFNIWKSVRNIKFKISKKVWFMIYICWGFGVPLFMVALAFILEHIPVGSHIRPMFGQSQCWFNGETEDWAYFFGPITVLLILNTVMFLQSCWTLWKSYKESTAIRIRSLRFKCAMYLKLFLLMGMTWIFEVISKATNFNKTTQGVWFITDCLNCSQGIFIFLILVVFRQKVRLGLLEHKVFNIKWPESWAKEELQESLSSSTAEELELANQKNKTLIESQKENLFS